MNPVFFKEILEIALKPLNWAFLEVFQRILSQRDATSSRQMYQNLPKNNHLGGGSDTHLSYVFEQKTCWRFLIIKAIKRFSIGRIHLKDLVSTRYHWKFSHLPKTSVGLFHRHIKNKTLQCAITFPIPVIFDVFTCTPQIFCILNTCLSI